MENASKHAKMGALSGALPRVQNVSTGNFVRREDDQTFALPQVGRTNQQHNRITT